MTALFYAGFICALVLFWVVVYALLRKAEKRWPAFSRWLDRHVGPEPEPWQRW